MAKNVCFFVFLQDNGVKCLFGNAAFVSERTKKQDNNKH